MTAEHREARERRSPDQREAELLPGFRKSCAMRARRRPAGRGT